MLFLLATVSCFERENEGPCSGCTSQHGTYTTTTGGTTSSISGSVDIRHDHGLSKMVCDTTERCAWSGSLIELSADVPGDWALPSDGGTDGNADADSDADTDAAADAGAEADAEAEADADADADAGADAGEHADAGVDAEAPDATTGLPRGWGADGRIAVIDLGTTPEARWAELDGARLIWCGDRHETLVTKPDGTYACKSATLRAPHIEALMGELRVDHSVEGETTKSLSALEAKTRSGLKIALMRSTSSAPLRQYSTPDCY